MVSNAVLSPVMCASECTVEPVLYQSVPATVVVAVTEPLLVNVNAVLSTVVPPLETEPKATGAPVPIASPHVAVILAVPVVDADDESACATCKPIGSNRSAVKTNGIIFFMS